MDIGSTGSPLPLKLAKKGYKVHTADVRKYSEKHPNIVSHEIDINNMPFKDNYFDVITCISTLEHIGLGAYDDPKYDNGDELAVREIGRVLKINGILIITFPFAKEYMILPWLDAFERIYNFDRVSILFKSWKILKSEYYIPKKAGYIPKNIYSWVKAKKEEAEKVYSPYPRSNLACFVLQKIV